LVSADLGLGGLPEPAFHVLCGIFADGHFWPWRHMGRASGLLALGREKADMIGKESRFEPQLR